MTREEIAIRALQATSFEGFDSFFWRSDGEYAPITMFVNCNDLFFWACADAEKITAENIGIFESTMKEFNSSVSCFAGSLFCCRSRKMRPQNCAFQEQRWIGKLPPEIQKLFKDCGPERTDAECG